MMRREARGCPLGPPAKGRRPLDPYQFGLLKGALTWPLASAPPSANQSEGSRGRLSLGRGSKGQRPLGPRRHEAPLRAWQAGRGAAAVPLRRRGPRPDQGAADAGPGRCRAVPLAGGTGLSVGRRARCATTGRCAAGGDGRPDGSDRPVGRAAAVLFRGRHPDAAVAIDRVARLSGPAGASVRGVLRPRRHQVPAGAGGGGGGAAQGLHAGSGDAGAAGAHRLRHAASDRSARRGDGAAAALRRTVRAASALGRSAGRADLRLARHACRGGGVRRRLAAAAAGSAHQAVGARRMVPARASMPPPACGPGTRRRASSCASARSI